MFFNENLYLEETDAEEQKVEPMTDEEIAEACEQAKSSDPVSEASEFYTYGLEQLNQLNEAFYNLSEKMMNVEHICALKESKGLIAESEAIMNESVEGFLNGLKNFFVKIGNAIKNLFNKFVEFMMGKVVSVKKIKEMNPEQAWKLFEDRNETLPKIKVKNYKGAEIMAAAKDADSVLKDLKAVIDEIVGNYKAAKSKQAADAVATFSRRPEKLRDRAKAAKNLQKEILAGFIQGSEYVENDTRIQKSEVTLDKALFLDRFNFVKEYSKVLDGVKKAKADADAVVKAGIDSVKNFQSEASDAQKKTKGVAIKDIKWAGSQTLRIFSKLQSVMSAYYAESLSIVRHVVGAQAAADVKAAAKKLGEGFDYKSYLEQTI